MSVPSASALNTPLSPSLIMAKEGLFLSTKRWLAALLGIDPEASEKRSHILIYNCLPYDIRVQEKEIKNWRAYERGTQNSERALQLDHRLEEERIRTRAQMQRSESDTIPLLSSRRHSKDPLVHINAFACRGHQSVYQSLRYDEKLSME